MFNLAIRNFGLPEPALTTGNSVGQAGSATLERAGGRIAGTIRGELADGADGALRLFATTGVSRMPLPR